jgi:L-ascorbate metabolism protein UlaG (beta-lactamase superfamily)
MRRVFHADHGTSSISAHQATGAWQVTWLGHSGFLIETKNGTRLLIDPWLASPTYPAGFQLPEPIDGILITHGHFDHAGSATELSSRYQAPIVGVFELASHFAPQDGPEGIGGNTGGTITIKGVQVTMVPAIHSSSIDQEGGAPVYTGNPVGFVLQMPGEKSLMHAGDTSLTQEFKMIGETLQPAVALLPIGGLFTMDPAQAATAAKWLGVDQVVPMHFGTFPALAGTPAQLRTALKGSNVTVTELTPGQSATF